MMLSPFRLCAATACLLSLFLCSSALSAPGKHSQLMSDPSYRESFEDFEKALQSARKNLDEYDFNSLNKRITDELTDFATVSMEAGVPEAEAWSDAYLQAKDSVETGIKRDWLRRHPDGIQGLYRMQNPSLDGFLYVQKNEAAQNYTVTVTAVQKAEPFNSGFMEGSGIPDGKKLHIYDEENRQIFLTITFSNDTASIAESKAIKEEGFLGDGVSFDGNWIREKK